MAKGKFAIQKFVIEKSNIDLMAIYLQNNSHVKNIYGKSTKFKSSIRNHITFFLNTFPFQEKNFLDTNIKNMYINIVTRLSEQIFTTHAIKFNFIKELKNDNLFKSIIAQTFQYLFRKIGISDKDINRYKAKAVNFDRKNEITENNNKQLSSFKSSIIILLSTLSVICFALLAFTPSIFVGALLPLKVTTLILAVIAPIALGYLLFKGIESTINFYHYVKGTEAAEQIECDHLTVKAQTTNTSIEPVNSKKDSILKRATYSDNNIFTSRRSASSENTSSHKKMYLSKNRNAGLKETNQESDDEYSYIETTKRRSKSLSLRKPNPSQKRAASESFFPNSTHEGR